MYAVTVEEVTGMYSFDYLEQRGCTCYFVELMGRRGILFCRGNQLDEITEDTRIIPVVLNEKQKVGVLENHHRMLMGMAYQPTRTVGHSCNARLMAGRGMHKKAQYITWEVIR